MSRSDEVAARVANIAKAMLSPEVNTRFREDGFGSIIVTAEINFSSCARISPEAMMWEGRGHDVSEMLGRDLALHLKESILKYATTVCLDGGAKESTQ